MRATSRPSLFGGSLVRAARPFRPVRAIRRRIEELLIRVYRLLMHGVLRTFAHVGLFVAIAAGSGFGSAWYMVDRGSSLTTFHYGPWTLWAKAGRADADPYTRLHFARIGFLPLAAPTAEYFMATRDSDGSQLYADCEYELTGRGPDAPWWSLTVYDNSGTLLEGQGNRHAISSPSLMRDTAGRFTIRLAPEARPGNWLPVSGQGGLTLLMRVYSPNAATGEGGAPANPDALPTIHRIECR